MGRYIFWSCWWIDPGRLGFVRRTRWLIDEAFRMVSVCLFKNKATCGIDLICLTIMYLIRRHQAKTKMVMLAIVSLKIYSAKLHGIFDTTKVIRKLRLVFHGLKLRF